MSFIELINNDPRFLYGTERGMRRSYYWMHSFHPRGHHAREQWEHKVWEFSTAYFQANSRLQILTATGIVDPFSHRI